VAALVAVTAGGLLGFHDRRRKAASEAALKLGLAGDGSVFQGELDRVRVQVTCGLGAGVCVTAFLSRPFEFDFTLRYVYGRPDTRVPEDPEFNAVCQIKSPAPERTLAALTSKELRKLIAAFLYPPDYEWTSRITQSEVHTRVRDAHKRGSDSVRAAIERAVGIAYRFDQRG
jgi:hypothetical protein